MLNQYYVRAKKFADEHVKPFAEEIDANAKFPTEIFDKISAEGFFKLIIPKELGGEGAGPDAQAYVSQAFGEGCATVGLCYTMHNVALKFVLTFGSEELKSFIIDEVVNKGKMLSLARSEFGTGVHVFQSQTQLEQGEGKVTINGVKSMITSANYADYYLISVPPTADGKVMNWLVPKGTEGLRFTESDWKGIGMRGNNSCPMHMENMQIDQKFGVHINREKHPQKYPVNIDVIYFMTGLAGVYSGMCQSIFEAAVNHATWRKYPGDKSLASIESVQIHLAEIYANLQAAKGALDEAVRALANEEDDGLMKIMTARILASENSIDSARIAMRIGGGQAYNKTGPIERLMRDSYASQVMFPSVDVLKLWTARLAAGLPMM